MTSRPLIPVNVIAGPLGVGKTTAVNHLLAQRPEHERWAVLVNEYGQVGLDAALLQGAADSADGDVAVREVAGGCICCSAGIMFQASLVLLLQRRPDRLIIEPTGLATVSGILDTLAQPGIGEAVDVRSVIALVDPAALDRDDPLMRETQDQFDAADILLANRSDLASDAQLGAFRAWASGFFPPKRFVDHIERGRIDLELLDRVRARSSDQAAQRAHTPDAHQRYAAHSHATAQPQHHGHHSHNHHSHDHTASALACSPEHPIVHHAHTSDLATTLGWTVWAERVFDADRVNAWLMTLTRCPGLRRLKAVFHTDDGWWSFNIADGAWQAALSAHRRDSRLEMIWTGASRPTREALEEGLADCLL